MAPTDTAVKSKQPASSKVDDKPETAQSASTDPSSTGHLHQTVSEASKLTDTATEASFQGATSCYRDDLHPEHRQVPEPRLNLDTLEAFDGN
ncbi:hypothetical protein IFR04_015689 [Cadophora malorum]|uniref:Uncharacterized protein n=1 Tax=Cadophora malorum TaxID=108018 RepID=A0A8H7W117_9HELO|nr:hypothetical protein IFR04_015689 [Cadophora malorum]